jgi:hypothetical protein
MEAWFLADREALASYYGQGFRIGSIPNQQNVELIRKENVLKALSGASGKTKSKGRYDKAGHAGDLLARIDPAKVRAASHHADRLIEILLRASR